VGTGTPCDLIADGSTVTGEHLPGYGSAGSATKDVAGEGVSPK
jgi:hypothetical protein